MLRRFRPWAVAIAAVLLWAIARWGFAGTAGLTRAIVTNSAEHTIIETKQVPGIDVSDIDGAAGGNTDLTATWRGAWDAPETAFYTFFLESRGTATWLIDDAMAVESGSDGRVSRTLWLDRGFHRLETRYAVDRNAPRLIAEAARAGEPSAPLNAFTLKPRLPKNPFLRSLGRLAVWLLGAIAIVSLVVAIRSTPMRWPAIPARTARALAWIVLGAILIHGALLRLDAITDRYGSVGSPHWIATLQNRTILPPKAIRTNWMLFTPEPLYPHADGISTHYRSDPYIYLDIARKWTSFYEPQFREPVFPFVTRLFLHAFDNQDVAVSFTSASFSLLAVWLTYLIGTALWSRPVGLIAALGLSLDYDVVSLATLGWRDDAYMAMMALCALLMIYCWRAGSGTSPVRRWRWLPVDNAYLAAAELGLAGGFAILTRIFAAPFLAIGGLFVLVALPTTLKRRFTIVGMSALLAVLVAGPYFLNCWIVQGDPLYTFNVHGGIYSVSEGQQEWKGTTASYIWQKIETRPYETFDTVAQGLTTYPFENKFHGLGRWISDVRGPVAVAALIGLLLVAALPEGRLLILATIGSLVPFAFTWKIDPHFRFTEYVYPLLLIAAAMTIVVGVRAIADVLAPGRRSSVAWWRGSSWRAWAGVVFPGLVVLWVISRQSPSWVFAETLNAREDANITAGVRDEAFFRDGWTPVLHNGNVNLRVTKYRGYLRVNLPSVDDYQATLRLDPFPEPIEASAGQLPTAEVQLNGQAIASIPLQFTAGRVGSYDIVLPRSSVRRGSNELAVVVMNGGAIGFWYLRVHPAK